MEYIENQNYDFDEFDKILFDTDIFENNISIGYNVDNANRKNMKEAHYIKLTARLN